MQADASIAGCEAKHLRGQLAFVDVAAPARGKLTDSPAASFRPISKRPSRSFGLRDSDVDRADRLQVHVRDPANVRESWAGIGRWLRHYNRERPHSALGNETPLHMYRTGRLAGAA